MGNPLTPSVPTGPVRGQDDGQDGGRHGGLDGGRPGTAEIVVTVLVGVWVAVATIVIEAAGWVLEQLLLVIGVATPAWAWPATVWINAVLVGVPAVLVATLARHAIPRAAGVTWSLASLILGVVGSLRAIPIEQSEIYFTSLAALAGVGGVVLLLVRVRSPRVRLEPVGVGLAAGVAVLVPWVWVGALGGSLESGLAVVAAAASGLLAAVTLSSLWGTQPSAATPLRTGMTGLAAGVALVPLGASIGASGPHLAEMVMLPPLGLLGAALARWQRESGPPILATTLLFGIAALGPLAFTEAAQTTVVIGLHDVGYWTAIGAALSIAIGLTIGGIALIATSAKPAPPLRRARRIAVPAALVLAAAAVLIVYPLAGHPGFFGSRLFVVMKTQADLSGVNEIKDRDERLRETYRRLTITADQAQASLRAKLHRDGIAYTPFYLVDGLEVDGDEATRIWLSRRFDVDRVLLNPRLRPIPSSGGSLHGTIPTPTAPGWNVALIDADQVWASGDTGQGIVIGSSDTGVDVTHPALAASYRGGDDSWFDPWRHSLVPVDRNGHGTHTTGSAVGSFGIGVAPGARWMACVDLDRDMGNPASYLRCLQFMLAPFPVGGDPFVDGNPSRAADVLTNSWACPRLEGCDRMALQPAVDALTAAGIFFVAAAGNEGPRCSSIDDAPAPYPSTFTVGAVNRERIVADFSSRGPEHGVGPDHGRAKPDVVAPGVGVVSALPGGGYGALDGTSMATPQVAGVVALMWSASPALRGNVPLTAEILRTTATPASSSAARLGDDSCAGAAQTGSGIVNAEAAVVMARTVH